MDNISDFRGKHYYLSNFYERDITCPSAANKLGRQIQLRSDWEQVKEDVMYEVCRAKFMQNPDLKARLLSTGTVQLVEGNNWNDREWGVCNGEGKNKLGKILMRIREELRNA